MKAHPFFYVIALAFLVWLIVAVWTRSADPATLTDTETVPTEPPPPPATTPDLTVELAAAQRKLAVSEAARKRERRGFRRRLSYVIHSRSLAGHWLERSFSCIHAGEGSWTDPNPPYFGGLQMDLSFQRAYGPWALRVFGTADRWPVSVQVATAIRAYVSGRGFYPWPNTARACGLLR